MINTLIKNWLITSIYLYLITLLSHLQTPITDTDIAYIINPLYFYLFAFAFFLALILQLWRSLLPTLNKNFGLCMILVFIIFIAGWMIFMPNFEPLFHLTLFLGILVVQLVQYRFYNTPLQKKNIQNEDKVKKLDKIWIFLGIFFSFTILYNYYINNRQDKVTYYKDAYPTKTEIQAMYSTPVSLAQIGTGVTASNHGDYNYASYNLSDYYIEEIYSSMSVKGQSTTFNSYRYYISLEKTADQDFTKIETNSEDLKLYYRMYENYDDGYDTITDLTPTHMETLVFAIYENEDFKVYLEAHLQDNYLMDETLLLKDMQLFFDHMRTFNHLPS